MKVERITLPSAGRSDDRRCGSRRGRWLDVTANLAIWTRDGDKGFAVTVTGVGGWEPGLQPDPTWCFCWIARKAQKPPARRKSTRAAKFYLRLAQRIMHLFSTRTSSGVPCEVDARPRPSGEAGMLVSQCWSSICGLHSRTAPGPGSIRLPDPCPPWEMRRLHASFDSIRRDILCRQGRDNNNS